MQNKHIDHYPAPVEEEPIFLGQIDHAQDQPPAADQTPQPREHSRRGFLKLIGKAAALAGTAATVGNIERETQAGIYKRQLDELETVMEPYMPETPQQRAPLRHDQTATASNPRLHEKLPVPADHAIVIVHPGYMAENTKLYQSRYGYIGNPKQAAKPSRSANGFNGPLSEEVQNDINLGNIQSLIDLGKGREGDYSAYQKRLTDVFAYARNNPHTPVIVYEGKNSLDANFRMYPEYSPPAQAISVATEIGSPKIADSVHYETEDGNYTAEQQSIDTLYTWLADNGITNIMLAGEYGLSRGGGIHAACAGGVGQALMDRGFSVHGIEGAVFPTQPMDLPTMKPTVNYAPLANALHHDTVRLPS